MCCVVENRFGWWFADVCRSFSSLADARGDNETFRRCKEMIIDEEEIDLLEGRSGSTVEGSCRPRFASRNILPRFERQSFLLRLLPSSSSSAKRVALIFVYAVVVSRGYDRSRKRA